MSLPFFGYRFSLFPIRYDSQDFQTGFQKTALEVSLKKAFETSKNTATAELAANIFSGGVSSGLLSAWATTQFSQIPIPIGFSVVATNNVVNPGVPQIILFSNKSTGEDFLNNLIEFFKAHLLSVSGLAIGTAVNGTPLTLPWTGIQ